MSIPAVPVRRDHDTASPSVATVMTDRIRANTQRMRAFTTAPVMAVVKADGFGLGAVPSARAALAGGAAELGVATCEEALALRAAGIDAPITAWLLYPDAPIEQAIRAGIQLSCASLEQLEQVGAAADRVGRRARIELECETGLNRSGCPPEQWTALCLAVRQAIDAGQVDLRGIWTHFAHDGDDPGAYAEPLARLERARAVARDCGLVPGRQHAAASLATVLALRTHLDLVRLGASLFGVEPVPSRPLGLEAVVRWTTAVAQVRTVPTGEGVGYGGRHRSAAPSRLALIPVGYADGVPRDAAKGLDVLVGGRRCPIVGAVSMDQSIVDVTGASVDAGDPVVLIGDGRAGEPTLHEWASTMGTIPQELLTGLGSRVVRHHVAEVAA